MYEIKFTTKLKKDLKRLKRQGKDMDKFFQIVEKLSKGQPLAERNRDHALVGNYIGCRVCHIEPDWLLIYEVIHQTLVLVLTRTGSHSELF